MTEIWNKLTHPAPWVAVGLLVGVIVGQWDGARDAKREFQKDKTIENVAVDVGHMDWLCDAKQKDGWIILLKCWEGDKPEPDVDPPFENGVEGDN